MPVFTDLALEQEMRLLGAANADIARLRYERGLEKKPIGSVEGGANPTDTLLGTPPDTSYKSSNWYKMGKREESKGNSWNVLLGEGRGREFIGGRTNIRPEQSEYALYQVGLGGSLVMSTPDLPERFRISK